MLMQFVSLRKEAAVKVVEARKAKTNY